MFPSTRSARALLAGMVVGGWLLLAAPVSAQVPASSVEVHVLDDGTVATVFRYDEPVVAGDGVFVHVLGAETRFAGAGISLEGQDPASWTPETPPEGPIDAFWTFDGWGADVDQIQVWLWLADVGGVEAVGVAYPPGTLDPDEIVSGEAGWSFSGEGFVSELPVVRADYTPKPFDVEVPVDTNGEPFGSISVAGVKIITGPTTTVAPTTTEAPTTTAAASAAPPASPPETAAAPEGEDARGLPIAVWVAFAAVLAALLWWASRRGWIGGSPDGSPTRVDGDDSGAEGTGPGVPQDASDASQFEYQHAPPDGAASVRSAMVPEGWLGPEPDGGQADRGAEEVRPVGEPKSEATDAGVKRAPSDVAEFDWRRGFQPSGDLRGDIRRLSEPLGPVDEFPTDPAERERWIRGRVRWRLQEELKRMEEKGVTPPEHLDLGDDLPIKVKRIAAEEWRTLREIGVGASTDPPSSGTGSPDRTDDGDEPDDQDFEETIL